MRIQGFSLQDVARIAVQSGVLECDQYDQHPRAVRFRKAVYRAVEAGLLAREKGSKPSRMRYRPTQSARDLVSAAPETGVENTQQRTTL